MSSPHEPVHITRNGRDYVVLLSAEDLESIEATLELLSDPAARERVRRAEGEGERTSVLAVMPATDARPDGRHTKLMISD